MSNSAYSISLFNLSLAFIPILIVMFIFWKWSLSVKSIGYASLRMISQLIFVGYALIVVFKESNVWISSAILMVMLFVASWIALRPISQMRGKYYGKTLFAIFAGGFPILMFVVFVVIQLDPWYMPRYLIPLAGMIFANAMNSVSLCAERLHSSLKDGKAYEEARKNAYQTSLLPLTNSFFAVGLVSIPGMMTGQILAGVSPLLAVRYQIMIMCMIFGACGISSAIFLKLVKDLK